jgi:hypothetical protein
MVWTPLRMDVPEPFIFTIFGRLEPSVPHADAEARLKLLARELAWLPDNYSGPSLREVGLPDLDPFAGRALWFLLAGAAFVLVVLCANVSNLVLAGLSSRRREFGMCTALGASRGRLIREAAVEHAIVGLAGVASGVWIAWGLTAIVPGVFQGHTLNLIDIDLRALAAASALGAASVLLSGVVPAWLGTRSRVSDAARLSPGAAGESRSGRMAARVLLAGEVALACSLLVGSALLVRSFTNLAYDDRGLDADGVTRLRVFNLDDAFGSYEAKRLAADAIEERFQAWPPIAAIALSRELPPDSWDRSVPHLGAAGTRPDLSRAVFSDSYRVSASFFDLYGIPIVRGRSFERGDLATDVVVSERLANVLWPGADPIAHAESG